MYEKSRILVVVFAAFLLSACGSTARFVEEPSLQIQGGSVSAFDAVRQIFDGRSTPYEISFCEADPETGECIDAYAAPSATAESRSSDSPSADGGDAHHCPMASRIR